MSDRQEREQLIVRAVNEGRIVRGDGFFVVADPDIQALIAPDLHGCMYLFGMPVFVSEHVASPKEPQP